MQDGDGRRHDEEVVEWCDDVGWRRGGVRCRRSVGAERRGGDAGDAEAAPGDAATAQGSAVQCRWRSGGDRRGSDGGGAAVVAAERRR